MGNSKIPDYDCDCKSTGNSKIPDYDYDCNYDCMGNSNIPDGNCKSTGNSKIPYCDYDYDCTGNSKIPDCDCNYDCKSMGNSKIPDYDCDCDWRVGVLVDRVTSAPIDYLDYELLDNKPRIGGTEIVGDLALSDIADAGPNIEIRTREIAAPELTAAQVAALLTDD